MAKFQSVINMHLGQPGDRIAYAVPNQYGPSNHDSLLWHFKMFRNCSHRTISLRPDICVAITVRENA